MSIEIVVPKTIHQALVAAQKAFGPALKNAINPHLRNKYADLGACIDAVIDALNENGLALIQKTHSSENGVAIETLFVHESGEVFSSGILRLPTPKNDPQGHGSALTYARRYSLMAACGIAPEDDDGNSAAEGKKKGKDGGHPLDNIPPPKTKTGPKIVTRPGETPKQAETRALMESGNSWVYGAGFIEAEGAEKRSLWARLTKDHGAVTDNEGNIHTCSEAPSIGYAQIGQPGRVNP